jgi:hypothetical protein
VVFLHVIGSILSVGDLRFCVPYKDGQYRSRAGCNVYLENYNVSLELGGKTGEKDSRPPPCHQIHTGAGFSGQQSTGR